MGCGESKKKKTEIEQTQEENSQDFNGFYSGAENTAYEKDIEDKHAQDEDKENAASTTPTLVQPMPRTSLISAVVEKINSVEARVDKEDEKPKQSQDEGGVQFEHFYAEPVMVTVEYPQEKAGEYLEPIDYHQEEAEIEDYLEPKAAGVEDSPQEVVETKPNEVDARKAQRMAIILQERMNLEKIRRQAKEKAEKDNKWRPTPQRRRMTLVGAGSPSPKVPDPVPWTQRRHTQPVMRDDLPVPGSLKRTHSQVMVDLDSLLKKKLVGKREHDEPPDVPAPDPPDSKFFFGPLAESMPEEGEDDLIVKEKKIVPEPKGEFSAVRTKLINELNLFLKPVEDQEVEQQFTANLEPVPEQEAPEVNTETVAVANKMGRNDQEFQQPEDPRHHTPLIREGLIVDFKLEDEAEEFEAIEEPRHHATLVQIGPVIDFKIEDEKEGFEQMEETQDHLMRERPMIDSKVEDEDQLQQDEEPRHHTSSIQRGPLVDFKMEDDEQKFEQMQEAHDNLMRERPEINSKMEDEDQLQQDEEPRHHTPLIQRGPLVDFKMEDENKKFEQIEEVPHQAMRDRPAFDSKVEEKVDNFEGKPTTPNLVEPVDYTLDDDLDPAIRRHSLATAINADLPTENNEQVQASNNLEERRQEQVKAEGIQCYMEGRSYERNLQILTAGTKYQLAAEKFTQIGSVELVLSSIVALIRVEMYEYAKKAIDKCKKSFPDDLMLIEALESTIPYYSEQHVYANADSVDVIPRFSADGVPQPRKRERRIPTKFSI